MSFKVQWHPRVRKALRKLPADRSTRIIKKMKEVSLDPFRYLESYQGKDYFKLRIGKYRALIEVDSNHKTLMVRVVEKRSRVYKK